MENNSKDVSALLSSHGQRLIGKNISQALYSPQFQNPTLIKVIQFRFIERNLKICTSIVDSSKQTLVSTEKPLITLRKTTLMLSQFSFIQFNYRSTKPKK